jgi:transposase
MTLLPAVNTYSFNIIPPPHLFHHLPNVWKAPCTVSLAEVLSFWRSDHNRTDSYRRSMEDGPVSMILHDNSMAHTADAVEDLLRRWRWEILAHPPYSPDMGSCDYLFSKMKAPLLGTRYNTREEIMRAVVRSLLDISRSGSTDDVRRLPRIWQKVVHMGGGDYTEGV